MAIAVGVLCSTEHGSRGAYPDTIVLIANDSRTANDDYGVCHQKVFVYPDEKCFGICIGRIETMGCELLPAVQKDFQDLTDRNPRLFLERINEIVFDYRRRYFQSDILSNYRFFSGDIPQEYHSEILELWQHHDIGAQVILGTFDNDGAAVMYIIGEVEGLRGWVHQIAFPGFATIGHGSHSANFWLSYRRQTSRKSVRRSAYHAYEAMRLALAPEDQNDVSELILATSDEILHLNKDAPEDNRCQVSLRELEEMYAQYGPHDTRELT
jgi:hypothetical protein